MCYFGPDAANHWQVEVSNKYSVVKSTIFVYKCSKVKYKVTENGNTHDKNYKNCTSVLNVHPTAAADVWRGHGWKRKTFRPAGGQLQLH